MQVKKVIQRGNTLHVIFEVKNHYCTPFATTSSEYSPEYLIIGRASFQVQVIASVANNCYNNLIFVKFVKKFTNDKSSYTINFSSESLGIKNKCLIIDDSTWRLIAEIKKQQYTFGIYIQLDFVPNATLNSLHEDSKLTDFELCGEDGSVQMHRAVLTAASPVLRQMLHGTWRQTSQGNVEVPGTSKVTIQHLKDYIYLHTLPDTGLEQVLLLASYYMMTDLEGKCVNKLVKNLTAKNVCELIEFAANYKVTSLMLAILDCVQCGAVKVDDIARHPLPSQ